MGIKDFFKRGAKADPAHVSVYQYLLDRGWTDAQIRAASTEGRQSTRTWSVAVVDQAAGIDPIVGIVYRADYKYEEEAGGGDLRKAFGVERFQMQMNPARRTDDLVRVFDLPEDAVVAGEVALAIATEALDLPVWGESVKGKPRGPRSAVAGYQPTLAWEEYAGFWESTLRWASPDLPGQRSWTSLENHKVEELKAIASGLGLLPVERGLGKGRVLKEDYLRALNAAKASHVTEFPGWFQTGKCLVLRATADSEAGRIASDVLRALWFAYREGTLGFGKGLSGPFSSGFSVLNVADVDGAMLEEQAEQGKWVLAQEKLLEPVAEELKARGHKWYFLGRPTLFTDEADGVVHYWLNGHSYPMDVGGNSQPYGYYSLAELLDEKFIRDLEEKNSGRVTGMPRF